MVIEASAGLRPSPWSEWLGSARVCILLEDGGQSGEGKQSCGQEVSADGFGLIWHQGSADAVRLQSPVSQRQKKNRC